MDWSYVNMLVTEHYWNDIEEAFKKIPDCKCDSNKKQIIYKDNVFQCRMIDDFCIGLVSQ